MPNKQGGSNEQRCGALWKCFNCGLQGCEIPRYRPPKDQDRIVRNILAEIAKGMQKQPTGSTKLRSVIAVRKKRSRSYSQKIFERRKGREIGGREQQGGIKIVRRG